MAVASAVDCLGNIVKYIPYIKHCPYCNKERTFKQSRHLDFLRCLECGHLFSKVMLDTECKVCVKASKRNCTLCATERFKNRR